MSERWDELNIAGWRICQDTELFRFGIDAILLAGFARFKKSDRVVDLCSGSGIIPFLYLARGDLERVTAVEYFPRHCELMRKTVERNGTVGLEIVEADVRKIDEHFRRGTFDVLTVNPPYEKNGHGINCPNDVKNAARREVLCDINDVCRAAAYLLKTGGMMYMIHRPSRMCDVMNALRENALEPREVRFVCSHAGDPPTLMLVSAKKGGSPYLRVQSDLVIYNEDGSYTKESSKIYDERV